MSLFLFLLAMEGLNSMSMIKTVYINGWIRGFNVARNGGENLEVTHLQYADDTLLMCKGDKKQLKTLRVILVLFEGISRLHINWRKNFLYPINEVQNLASINVILGGEVVALPTIYLGMPLGAKSLSTEIWSGVIEKC